jgi:hypothetical protein
MMLIVPPAVNGWSGAAPVVSCQIAPLSSVANARLPVEPTLQGTAVAT